MKLFTLPFLVLATASSVKAEEKRASKQMQINYFNDFDCTSFAHQVDVSWANKHLDKKNLNCYNFNLGYSVAMVQCNGAPSACDCTFYFEKDCQPGNEGPLVRNDGQCYDQASQFKSFRCFYN